MNPTFLEVTEALEKVLKRPFCFETQAAARKTARAARKKLREQVKRNGWHAEKQNFIDTADRTDRADAS